MFFFITYRVEAAARRVHHRGWVGPTSRHGRRLHGWAESRHIARAELGAGAKWPLRTVGQDTLPLGDTGGRTVGGGCGSWLFLWCRLYHWGKKMGKEQINNWILLCQINLSTSTLWICQCSNLHWLPYIHQPRSHIGNHCPLSKCFLTFSVFKCPHDVALPFTKPPLQMDNHTSLPLHVHPQKQVL